MIPTVTRTRRCRPSISSPPGGNIIVFIRTALQLVLADALAPVAATHAGHLTRLKRPGSARLWRPEERSLFVNLPVADNLKTGELRENYLS